MKGLPPGWRRVTFGEAAETALGKMLDKGRPRGLPQVPYLRNINVQWGSIDLGSVLKMELADEERERFGLRAGDLLVCEGGEIGRAAIWRGSPGFMAYQKALHRVRPNPGTEPSFLRYQLECLANDGTLARFSTGSTIAHLPQQALRAVPIALPSVKTQRRIVAILEEHLSDLDEASGSLRSARERSDALWVSALRRAQEAAQKHGVVSSIGQLADTTLGKMLDAKRQMGEVTPYLRNINVRWGHFDLDDLQTTPLTDADRDRLVLEEGDLLVCEGGEPGRCAVWSQPESGIAFQKALHRVRIAEGRRLTPEFLAAMIEEGIRVGRWERFFTGTTIKHLPQQQLRRLEVPVPPLQLQESLVAQLSEQRAALDRLREQVSMAERREQSLRQAVLAAAFSGRLTGHGSDTDAIKELAEEASA